MCGQGVMTSWVQCHQSSGMRHIVPLAVPVLSTGDRESCTFPRRTRSCYCSESFLLARKVVIFSGFAPSFSAPIVGRLSVVQHGDLPQAREPYGVQKQAYLVGLPSGFQLQPSVCYRPL